MLCGVAGIEQATLANSAAYLKSWIARFKSDSRSIISGASAAQKAADYILEESAKDSPAVNTDKGEVGSSSLPRPTKPSRKLSAGRFCSISTESRFISSGYALPRSFANSPRRPFPAAASVAILLGFSGLLDARSYSRWFGGDPIYYDVPLCSRS